MKHRLIIILSVLALVFILVGVTLFAVMSQEPLESTDRPWETYDILDAVGHDPGSPMTQ